MTDIEKNLFPDPQAAHAAAFCADCGGALKPIRVEIDSKKGYMIVHKCEKCGAIRRNRTAHEAKIQPDDLRLIIKLTAAEP